jgi:hypothetical protein
VYTLLETREAAPLKASYFHYHRILLKLLEKTGSEESKLLKHEIKENFPHKTFFDFTDFCIGGSAVSFVLPGKRYSFSLFDLFLVFRLQRCCFNFKVIVQPKNRGVKRGANRFVSTSYTIAGIF